MLIDGQAPGGRRFGLQTLARRVDLMIRPVERLALVEAEMALPVL